jgi:hypothetical protein
MEPDTMSLHRILRVTSRGRVPTVMLREIAHYEDAPFSDEELALLNAGRHVVRPEAVIVDLNAHYEAVHASRVTTALGLVS